MTAAEMNLENAIQLCQLQAEELDEKIASCARLVVSWKTLCKR